MGVHCAQQRAIRESRKLPKPRDLGAVRTASDPKICTSGHGNWPAYC